jgi:hypothetical protein
MQAILSPLALISFVILAGEGTLGNHTITIFGHPAFSRVATNVYALNPLIYAVYSIASYGALCGLDFLIVRLFKRGLSLPRYLSHRANLLCLVPGVISGVTLIVYAEGMEGNILGFFFAPALLLALAWEATIWMKGWVAIAKDRGVPRG